MISKKVSLYFGYKHLPEHLQQISKPFHDLVTDIAKQETENNGNEIEYSLRMLLCAKDSAVRAVAALK